MDSSIGRFDPNLNPLSRQFLSRATDNMATQMNTVRTQAETKPEDDAAERQIVDMAVLDASTVTGTEGLDAAAFSGELGELADTLVEDDAEDIEESRGEHGYAVEDEESEARGFGRVRGEQAVPAQRTLARADFRDVRDRMADLRSDVPDEIWTASASMVEGQMVNQTPKAALMQLKPIAEQGKLEMAHADYAEMMDLTDRQTGPMPLDLDAA